MQEEDDRRKLEMAAREEAAKLHFEGVGGHIFSDIIPFDEDDDENDEKDENHENHENDEKDEDDESSSSASSDDDGEFIDGGE